MNRSKILVVALATVLGSSAALGQGKSVAGTWDATVTTPNGGGKPTLTFVVKGDSVTGTVKRPNGEVLPLKGTINGKDLTYSYTVAMQSGDVLVTVKAKVVGDSLNGTMSFGGAMTGEIKAARAKP